MLGERGWCLDLQNAREIVLLRKITLGIGIILLVAGLIAYMVSASYQNTKDEYVPRTWSAAFSISSLIFVLFSFSVWCFDESIARSFGICHWSPPHRGSKHDVCVQDTEVGRYGRLRSPEDRRERRRDASPHPPEDCCVLPNPHPRGAVSNSDSELLSVCTIPMADNSQQNHCPEYEPELATPPILTHPARILLLR